MIDTDKDLKNLVCTYQDFVTEKLWCRIYSTVRGNPANRPLAVVGGKKKEPEDLLLRLFLCIFAPALTNQ
jgi:hypothetical protein